MSETVYIETSIFGYLTVRPSNNLILMAHAEITRQWWEKRRGYFSVYISQVVLDEAEQGEVEIATKRLEILRDYPLLGLNKNVQDLASQFLTKSNLPHKAANDAIHIAVATVYGLDYLLTWNCRYIANAQMQKKLQLISFEAGYELPIICTPLQLMGE